MLHAALPEIQGDGLLFLTRDCVSSVWVWVSVFGVASPEDSVFASNPPEQASHHISEACVACISGTYANNRKRISARRQRERRWVSSCPLRLTTRQE